MYPHLATPLPARARRGRDDIQKTSCVFESSHTVQILFSKYLQFHERRVICKYISYHSYFIINTVNFVYNDTLGTKIFCVVIADCLYISHVGYNVIFRGCVVITDVPDITSFFRGCVVITEVPGPGIKAFF